MVFRILKGSVPIVCPFPIDGERLRSLGWKAKTMEKWNGLSMLQATRQKAPLSLDMF